MTDQSYTSLPSLNQNIPDENKEAENIANELKSLLPFAINVQNNLVVFSYNLSSHFGIVRVFNNYSIQMQTMICKSLLYHPNGQLLTVKAKYLRLEVAKFFSAINRQIEVGYFSIDPIQGFIKLSMGQKIQNQQKQRMRAFKYLHEKSAEIIDIYIFRILCLIDMIRKQSKMKDLPAHWSKFNIEPLSILKSLKVILKDNCTLDMNLKQYQKERKHYISYFDQQDTQTILTNIKVYTPLNEFEKLLNRENQIAEGGFSNIFKVSLNTDLENNNNKLVVKKEKNQEYNVLLQEKNILQHLSTKEQQMEDNTCKYIGRYFQSPQDGYSNYLFMEYYFYRSLTEFREIFSNVQSLTTKLYLLSHLAVGLRYLSQKHVTHIDLKPHNILLTRNMCIKIIDFGSSFCPLFQNTDSNVFRPARTMPYTAPEFFSKQYVDRHDVFSFGIIMYEFLFEQFPTVNCLFQEYYYKEYKHSAKEKFEEKYKNKIYQIRIEKKQFLSKGPRKLMKLLRSLIMKCLLPNNTERPRFDWIILILREACNYLAQIYQPKN